MAEGSGYKPHRAHPRDSGNQDEEAKTAAAGATSSLSEQERQHCAEMKTRWETYFPEDPLLKELYARGMIDGYRNVLTITPHEAEAT